MRSAQGSLALPLFPPRLMDAPASQSGKGNEIVTTTTTTTTSTTWRRLLSFSS